MKQVAGSLRLDLAWAQQPVEVYADLLVPWFFLVAILGYGGRFLNFSNRVLTYAAQASYPVYILHQTIILAIGFHVIRLDAPLWLEYLIIVLSSFAITIALYELLIRRINPLRFLFGLKPLRRPQTPLR